MAIQELPFIGGYDKQRFTQYGSQDAVNWYQVADKGSKKHLAMYPALGRTLKTITGAYPSDTESAVRALRRTNDFFYAVVGDDIYKIDTSFVSVTITGAVQLNTTSGDIWFTTMINAAGEVYAIFADGDANGYYVYKEGDVNIVNHTIDASAGIANPLYLATLGNRVIVSSANTPQYAISQVSNPLNFADAGGTGVPYFNSASDEIKQLGVLHNTLYIFTPFTIDIWSNQTTVLGNESFPFRLNTSYNFDYGIASPHSLSIDFGRMIWLAQNRSGVVQVMASSGGQPTDLNDQSIDVLLQSITEGQTLADFLDSSLEGFIYQYENNIFYRLTGGARYINNDRTTPNQFGSLEFNFSTQTWHRLNEIDRSRNRIQKHVFFEGQHIVSLIGTVELRNDVETFFNNNSLYQMSGYVYTNDSRSNKTGIYSTVTDDMYYLRDTTQIFQPDYSEFITDYIEIDFVFGKGEPDRKGPHFKPPTVELFYSDDGGVTFSTADVREFSQLGQWQWRMRWYQLGPSRNRVYRLISYSAVPIAVLGAVQNVRRASGGNN